MIPQSILDFFHAGKSLPFRSMTFFNFLAGSHTAGSVLILVMLVLRRVFRKRIGSRLVYLAWILVAIRLLVPVALPNPLMDSLRPTLSHDAGARPADQIRVRYQDTVDAIAYRLSVAAYESGSPVQQSLSDLAHDVETYTSYGWLGKGYLMLYALGAALVATVFTARHIRYRRNPREYDQSSGRATVGALSANLRASPCEGHTRHVCRPAAFPPGRRIQADDRHTPDAATEGFCEALLHELNHYRARDTGGRSCAAFAAPSTGLARWCGLLSGLLRLTANWPVMKRLPCN